MAKGFFRGYRAVRLPPLSIDLEADWREYTRLLPKDCIVIGVVKIGNEAGVLVKLKTGVYAQVNEGRTQVLNQTRIDACLLIMKRNQERPLELVEIGDH